MQFIAVIIFPYHALILYTVLKQVSEKIFFFTLDKNYNHTELLIIFFQHLKSIILKNHDINTNIKAVITVPSNFNDMMREIIKNAFISVGFQVIRIINEPSAAALAYGLNHSSSGDDKILVIDTGGGTMDFTILQKSDLFFEVIHSEGLNTMGGNNFTQIIVDDMIKNKELKDISNNILWNQAQRVKEKLTYLETYETKILSHSYILSRIKFDKLTQPLIKQVEYVLESIMNNHKDINYIVLVGGTSRIPILQRTIKDITKMNPWIHPNLETVVSEGAGLFCGILENKFTANEDVVLLDVLPLSLGVELVDGTFSVIIPKNTPVPVKRSQRYTTDSPCDSSVNIKVYQGERVIANKNFLIGEIIFDKVSMGGVPIIEIAFKVDLNSIITVTVIDKKSGLEKNILLKDIPKIDMKDIEEIINNSSKLADSDMMELTRNQNIYLIRTHIENTLANLQINDLIDGDSKKNILERFKEIEDTVENMNNLQLLDTLKELQDKYSIMGSAHINEENVSEYDNVEKMLLQERKEELKTRIELLLAKNPDWEEFLNPVLESIAYSSCTSEYVNDKINLLNELESSDTNNTRDYKEELKNLCLYLNKEIELGSITDETLINMINNNLVICNSNSDINWEEKLNILNKKCEEIYNL
jgi:molecular chaperone DnaK